MFNLRSWALRSLIPRSIATWLVLCGATPSATALELAACAKVPKVSTATLSSLHTLELNRHINAGYAKFAQCFQGLAEGNVRADQLGGSHPIWYAFAPYASRVVGVSEAALERTLAAASELASVSVGSIAKSARGFVESMLGALSAGARGANLDGVLSPKVMAYSAACVVGALIDAPYDALSTIVQDKAGAIVRTLRNMLEDGNRRIYSDVAGSGARYLNWRAQRSAVSADDVLSTFVEVDGGSPAKARAIYDYATAHLADSPLPTRFDKLAGGAPKCRNAMSAAFALYEEAGRATDLEQRNRRIDFGNNLIAFCEQYSAVQPAFAPPKKLAGEVDRMKLMSCVTPTTWLTFRNVQWTLAGFAKRTRLDLSRINWGRFADRWPAILDAFKTVYAAPRTPWPMPNPDATQEP